jgi:hypothetical protein
VAKQARFVGFLPLVLLVAGLRVADAVKASVRRARRDEKCMMAVLMMRLS